MFTLHQKLADAALVAKWKKVIIHFRQDWLPGHDTTFRRMAMKNSVLLT